jgi:hypothetical protein
MCFCFCWLFCFDLVNELLPLSDTGTPLCIFVACGLPLLPGLFLVSVALVNLFPGLVLWII